MNHPAYQVPLALILLPAEGGKIKVYFLCHQVSHQFSDTIFSCC